MIKRLSGQKNFLYIAELGTEVTTGALTVGTWYKITAIAASASALAASAVVGDVFYCGAALTLGTGDKVKPITMEKVGFCTNIPGSASKEKYENTVQTDDNKSYVEGDKAEKTGTIEGYFIVGDDLSKEILGRFFRVVTYTAGVPVFEQVKTGVLHFFLGRNETTTVGDTDVMEYMPSIIDSLTADKPMEGTQPFSCGYTVVGSERPSIHYRPITT